MNQNSNTQKQVLVLGAGHVGKAMAIDLKKSGYEVSIADLDMSALVPLEDQYGIRIYCEDFMNDSILGELLEGQDLVVGAAPGAVGYRLMERVIRNGKDMVDISFCPEDYLELDKLAKEMDVTVVADMGVAPGMCNAILGYCDTSMDVASYKCIVGGLPYKREWPLEYKSSWSPIDCIEEYTRPARFKVNGALVVKPALSDTELVEFDEIGTLEEWNSDGLRSLLKTMDHVPDMVEKTLRYPGTINFIRALRDLGYFSYDKIEVDGKMIRPIDLSAKLLFPLWKLEKGESEFTIMRVTITGKKEGRETRIQYDLMDSYDEESDTLSMARTTGYTCTGVAEMLLKGMIKEKGVLAPEEVGRNQERFRYLLSYLKDRNVVYRVKEA